MVHKSEAEFLKGLSPSDLIKAESGDKIEVGGMEIQLLHTPGHTPGSQCFLVDDRIVSGDTLFIGACGRVDLPGGNAEQLYYSLTQKLMALPDDTIFFPATTIRTAQLRPSVKKNKAIHIFSFTRSSNSSRPWAIVKRKPISTSQIVAG